MASKRGYLSQTELAEFADITILDATEADDQISMAEEIIDDYVGPQDKFLQYEVRGLISAGGSNGFTLESIHVNNMQKNYLRGCFIEIMGGAGEGQRAKITNQTYEGVITVDTAFSTPLDTTSYYRIWQLGKFPRSCDVEFDGAHTPSQYYKSVPEKIRRAVAAQVEYRINMGDKFFGNDKTDIVSESIGDYAYTKSESSGGASRLIAPKAKLLLKGIVNRTGQII